MEQGGPKWTKIDHRGPKGNKMDHNGPQRGQKWTTMMKTELNKVDQNKPICRKTGQNELQ